MRESVFDCGHGVPASDKGYFPFIRTDAGALTTSND
jgi:hypothetical protein